MVVFNIKLTFKQMFTLGIHLGHSLNASKFLSYWIYGGWRSNMFIINLVKTRFLLKSVIDVVNGAISNFTPIWFINLDRKRTGFIARYAIYSGEPHSTYLWINGTLTNYKSIFSWYNMLYKLVKLNKYKMRQRDKIKLLSFFGFLNHRSGFPGLGFITSTLLSWHAVSEFWAIAIPCAAVVDSNILSWNVSFPIPGNDDSLVCLNYYCFIITRTIIYSKAMNYNFFREIIKKNSALSWNALKFKKKFLLIYLFKRRDQNMFLKKRYFFLKKYYFRYKTYLALNRITWNVKNLPINMRIFNTQYAVFHNSSFFKFCGYKKEDKDEVFEPIIDIMYHDNDPYKLY